MNIRTITGIVPRMKLLAAILVVGLLLGPGTVAAQDAQPSADLAGASITVDVGETNTVTAEYQFNVSEAGSGDSEISSISGTIWKLPDRDISDISATVDGESVDPSVSEGDRHLDVSFPVEGVEDGDTVTVTLEYEVAGPAGKIRAPLWVPEYSTPGQANVIDMTLNFPEETTVSGSTFPSPDGVDGNVASYDLLHTPGFVAAEYDDTGPGILTTDTLYSILGVVVMVGFIVGGLAIDRKTA